jgi:DNA-binding transcriptional LysR family regulator
VQGFSAGQVKLKLPCNGDESTGGANEFCVPRNETSLDKLLALKAFVAVAQAGGFSKAARKLGVATSSLTRQIDVLEASLGSALLTRSTRQVTLTDTGMGYLEQVSRILAELDIADGSVADLDNEPVGSLRVSVPVTYGRLCLGPHIAAFLQRHPKVSLNLQLSDRHVELHDQRIDVAVRIGMPAADPNLVVRLLSQHQRYVVASPDYLARAGIPLRPKDLTGHDCLQFDYESGPQRWAFGRGGVLEHVDVRGRLDVNNADLLRDAVLGGLGIALLAEWLVNEDVAVGRMQRLFADYAVNPFDNGVYIYAAYLPNRRHSRKVQAFLTFLEERVGYKLTSPIDGVEGRLEQVDG